MSLTHRHEIKYRLKLVFITENFEEITVYPISTDSDHGYYDYLEPEPGLVWFKEKILMDDVKRGSMSITLNSVHYLFEGNGMIPQKAIAVKVYYEKIERVIVFWEVCGEQRTRVAREILLETNFIKNIKKQTSELCLCNPLSDACLERLRIDDPESFEHAATLREYYELRSKGEIK